MARDWTAVKAAYLAGAEASTLARQFRIPLATIESKASRGKWGRERKAVARDVQAGLHGAVVGAATAAAADAGLPSALDLAEAQAIAATIARNTKEQGGVRLAALRLAGEWGGWKDAGKHEGGGLADALALVRQRRAARAGGEPGAVEGPPG